MTELSEKIQQNESTETNSSSETVIELLSIETKIESSDEIKQDDYGSVKPHRYTKVKTILKKKK